VGTTPATAGGSAAGRTLPPRSPTASSLNSTLNVRIGLKDPAARWEVASASPLSVRDSAGRTRRLPAGSFTIASCRGARGICAEGEGWGLVTQDGVTFEPDEGPFLFAGKRYRGTLQFIRNGGELQPIGRLPIEEYLRGVVPLEIGKLDEAALEAMKAQAVAARTYTHRNLRRRASLGFDLWADTRDQVYGGVDAEHGPATRAVTSTERQILSWQGGFAETFYHSTCSGQTASVASAWGLQGLPYLASSPDRDPSGRPWCQASHYLAWERHWTRAEFTAAARKWSSTARPEPDIAFREVKDLRVAARTADDRVQTLELVTDAGTLRYRSDRTRWLLREAGSTAILPSSRFWIEKTSNGLTVRGSGSGHGIGLCQMGARERARAGQNYSAILEAYYPGTSLQTVGAP